MADKRIERTRETVKNALLRLLERETLSRVTVADLAREAGISRSTFYSHFLNVLDVYELLIADFFKEIKPLDNQLRCEECLQSAQAEKTPYCIAVRTSKTYRNVVRESLFLPTMVRLAVNDQLMAQALAPYLKLGVATDTARDLYAFQMAGCHTVALSGTDDVPWADRQRVLDTFIAGGMRAVGDLCRNGE